jgi:hypothetical protein
MIRKDCGQSMSFHNVFEKPEEANEAIKLLENAVGRGASISTKNVTGGTEVVAQLNCRAFRASHNGAGCLLEAMQNGGVSVPRTCRPSCAELLPLPVHA